MTVANSFAKAQKLDYLFKSSIFPRSQANSSVFNMDIVPEKSGELVTTLLRASREGNEGLIKSCLRDIIVGGISNEELNSTDKSGRVSHQSR